jgi:hypothetical protein
LSFVQLSLPGSIQLSLPISTQLSLPGLTRQPRVAGCRTPAAANLPFLSPAGLTRGSMAALSGLWMLRSRTSMTTRRITGRPRRTSTGQRGRAGHALFCHPRACPTGPLDARVERYAVRLTFRSPPVSMGCLHDGPCDPGSPCAGAPNRRQDSHGRMDHPTEELTAKGLTSGQGRDAPDCCRMSSRRWPAARSRRPRPDGRGSDPSMTIRNPLL